MKKQSLDIYYFIHKIVSADIASFLRRKYFLIQMEPWYVFILKKNIKNDWSSKRTDASCILPVSSNDGSGLHVWL